MIILNTACNFYIYAWLAFSYTFYSLFIIFVAHNRFCESESYVTKVTGQRDWTGENTGRPPLSRSATLPHSFNENESNRSQFHSRSFRKICPKRLRLVGMSCEVVLHFFEWFVEEAQADRTRLCILRIFVKSSTVTLTPCFLSWCCAMINGLKTSLKSN